MKTWLTIIALLLAPIGATGALIYKIAEGDIKDPTFYALIVILPSSILASIKELKSVVPPDRILATIQEGIRGKHWKQGSNWSSEHSRELTSLYIPIRLENNDTEKAVTLYDVKIFDRLRRIPLSSPNQNEIKIGSNKEWMFAGCDLAFKNIFNFGQTAIGSTSTLDSRILIQEEGHNDRYDLAIEFKDNYGRKYFLECPIVISEVNNWQKGTTEWST